MQEQFQALVSLFSRDIGAFMSDLGLDFLATFGSTSKGENSIQAVQREMRKIYSSYKARDSLMLESKKSIVYSLILKTIIYMFKEMPDQRIMRVADASVGELQKELVLAEDGQLAKLKPFKENVEIFTRVRVIQQFLKNFFISIQMQVMQNKGTMMTKQQDELAFLKFVEDLCRFGFSSP